MSATDSILRPGHNCWRLARASRASVLIDAAAYFAALRDSLLQARHSVLIVGWDIDSRTRLPRHDGDDQAPEDLRGLLCWLVQRRPRLQVHILLWDYTVLYAPDRELLPRLQLNWRTPARIRVCLDDALPVGACRHQKIVVVDGCVAYCGGIDLTVGRWDTPAHAPRDPRRVLPDGASYAPRHDAQMLLEGEAAAAIGELVRARWDDAACTGPQPPQAPGRSVWPRAVAADFSAVQAGLARTEAPFGEHRQVREIETLVCEAIAAARTRIYAENQYFTAGSVADALVERLRRDPPCEVALVGPEAPRGWLEQKTMGYGRRHFVHRLREGGVMDRVRMVYPAVRDGERAHGVLVHAKTLIVDDRLLITGSANLNNRSMGLDGELNVAIEARDRDQRRRIAGVRDALLGEHLGLEIGRVAAGLERGSMFALIDARDGGARALLPMPEDPAPDELGEILYGVSDPERPVDPERLVGDMFAAHPAPDRAAPVFKVAAVAALVAAAVLAWRYTPLASVLMPERLLPAVAWLAGNPLALLVVPLAFVAAGLVLFPVTVLIALTALVFEPWVALGYSTAGSMASALVTFELGARYGHGPLQRLLGRWSSRVRRALDGRGVLAVAALRLIPVAPYTVVNVVAGASGIGRREFVLGSLIGLAPGLVLATVLGRSLRVAWEIPGAETLAMVAAVIVLWIALAAGIHRLVRWARRRRDA